MVDKDGIDPEVVEGLRKSKDIVGYLVPCVRDKTTKQYLSGKHRKEADPNWPEIEKETKDDLERIVLKIHYNYQRRVNVEETEADLLQLAKLVEQTVDDPRDVCAEVCRLVPYTARWVRLLLPPTYKRDYEKSELIPILHKDVKKKFDRVKDSQKLSEHLKKLEQTGKIKTLERDAYAEDVQEMGNTLLPFPDCACSTCPHYKKCYGV